MLLLATQRDLVAKCLDSGFRDSVPQSYDPVVLLLLPHTADICLPHMKKEKLIGFFDRVLRSKLSKQKIL
jgi:hypothetical protein